MIRYTTYFLILFVLAFGCREKYTAELKSSDKSALVVEGFLNYGGTTSIKLSRSYSLADSGVLKPELKAVLTIEANDNTVYNLTEGTNGVYTAATLPLSPSKEYRLRIKTSNGKQYLSDFVNVQLTPAIDSVNWARQNNQLKLFVNTHDDTNQNKFYKWDFTETWEINSYFFALYKVNNGKIVEVDLNNPVDNNYRCWKSMEAQNIIVGSTTQLQSAIISNMPLNTIPINSEKLSVRYSILVRQQSLTKPAFEYFQLMKKNTETLGSVFDPQPSELRGNIISISDPDEIVVGYFYASSLSDKRIFITRFEVSGSFSMECESRLIPNKPDSIAKYLSLGYLPYEADISPLQISGYHVSIGACVDCRVRGGNTEKPSFW